MERDKRSWKVVSAHVVPKKDAGTATEDKWKVDRKPPVGTRTVRVSYREIKVYTRHDKK